MTSIDRRRFLGAGTAGALLLAGCSEPMTQTGAIATARPRSVARIVSASARTDGAGVKLHRALGGELADLDPFLMLDEIRSSEARDYEKGFPRHPHRGFETVTYMLSGAMEHRDSVGSHGLLRAGSTQWMTAGSGIIHSEMPLQKEGLLWGFQLWVNLPAALKMSKPRYQDIAPEAIPEISVSGSRVRLVAGSIEGQRGPADGIVVDPTLLDVSISAGSALEHALISTHNAFVYVLEGTLAVGPERTEVHARQLAVLGPGESALLASSPDSGASKGRALLLSGQPIGEPIARRGPFVMNTNEELEQAMDDYRTGRLVEGG